MPLPYTASPSNVYVGVRGILGVHTPAAHLAPHVYISLKLPGVPCELLTQLSLYAA